MPRRASKRHRPLTLATLAGFTSLILPSITLARLYSNGPVLKSSLLPVAYTCSISGLTFLMYGYDKMQAQNLQWRVNEWKLHLLGLLGGWPGALVGMHSELRLALGGLAGHFFSHILPHFLLSWIVT